MMKTFCDELSELKLDEHFIMYVDCLGTREAIKNNEKALELLKFLISLSEFRSDFSVTSEDLGGFVSSHVKQAFSVFSDNIAISSPLEKLVRSGRSKENAISSTLEHMRWFLSLIARKALEQGFLIRGGATIGPLYHANGVIFGNALVEAVELESKVAAYPRVLLSSKIPNRERLIKNGFSIDQSDDGLMYIDYYGGIISGSAQEDGPNYARDVRNNFNKFMEIIGEKLRIYNKDETIREYAKWMFFAESIRKSLRKYPKKWLDECGVSMDGVPKENLRPR